MACFTSWLPEAKMCYPCLRNVLLPLSRDGHQTLAVTLLGLSDGCTETCTEGVFSTSSDPTLIDRHRHLSQGVSRRNGRNRYPLAPVPASSPWLRPSALP